MSGQVTVSSDEIFDLLVEGVRADTPDGYIALDSVTLTPGPCIIPGTVHSLHDFLSNYNLVKLLLFQ